MTDDLEHLLRSWTSSPPSGSFEERMKRLFAEPPAARVVTPRPRRVWWPAAVFVTCVAALVWSMKPHTPGAGAAVLGHDVRVVPLDGHTVGMRGVERVEYVTQLRLDRYVPVRHPRLVVERRSR